MTQPALSDRLRGGLLGLLVGDALGVPYEFHAASAVPAGVDMTPPPGFDRTYPHVPVGTWSDDGAQALVLLDSLQRRGRLDVEDLAAGFLRWRDAGFMAVDGHSFDIGMQTDAALQAYADGTPAALAGPTGERANGNGSLMRVLPLALWHEGQGTTDADLVTDAFAQSAVTHGHVRAQACCALYVLWARRLLRGAAPAQGWDEAVEALTPLLDDAAREELHAHVVDRVGAPVRGSGYVVDSLLAAHHLLTTCSSYEDVVVGAVRLGEDTDTTAAIAGGLAGAVYGEKGIRADWLAALRGRELVDPLLARLA